MSNNIPTLTEKDYTLQPVKVYYLEMHDKPSFALPHKEEINFIQLEKPISAATYRYYYYNVGCQWNWLDRLTMTDEELSGKINAGRIEVFILKENNNDAGYAEFDIQKDRVEVVYFGLFPSYVGKGLGKFFLQWIVNKGWSYNPQWIQLNTCALDHPNALNVYQSVGLRITRTEVQLRKILNKTN
jgi:GNAT superfamily N-acetyltransferase